jgi:hypothetical protein
MDEVRESVEEMQKKLHPRQQMNNRPARVANNGRPNGNANARGLGNFDRRSKFKTPPTDKSSQ